MTYARLIYIGVTLLHRTEQEVELMPFGELLDQWELHRQFSGTANPKVELYIDQIIPDGI